MTDTPTTPEETAFLAQVRPQLESLEEIRLQKRAVYLLRKKLAIPLALILTPVCGYIDWLLLLWQRGSDDSAAGLTVVVLGALYTWVTVPRRQYAKAYKKDILPRLAGFLGNLTYSADGKIPMEMLKPSKIVPGHDRYKSEDYFEGAYRGVRMQFSEIELTETRGSGKNRRTVTVFKGLAILLDMTTKKFYGHTILVRDLNKVAEWFQEKTLKMKRADLVDPEFEKLFDIYTNDQVEARYLIDPAMIERIKGLYEEYDGERMSAAYFDSRMLILIASRHNHFEPASIHTPATSPESVLNMKREIAQILSIIDYLQLYDPHAVHAKAAAEAAA